MAKIFYVSQGQGANFNGSAGAPFPSLYDARDAIREMIRGGMTEDIVVYVGGGVYEMTSALTFDERDSGRDGYRISYGNCPGEEPILIGGVRLSGWEPHEGPIWKTRLPDGLPAFHTLYDVDGRVSKARLPAEGYFETAESEASGDRLPDKAETVEIAETEAIGGRGKPDEAGGFYYRSGDLQSVSGCKGVQAFVWPGEGEWNWFSETLAVREIDGETRRVSFQQSATWGIGAGSRYYLQGALAFLQVPGQFHLDEETRIVYYWPRTGVPGERAVVAPSATRLLSLTGSDPERPVRGLDFSGMTLECTDFFREYRMMRENAEREEHREGLVYCNNAEEIRLSGCRIRNAGSCAVYLDRYCRRVTVEDCRIEHAGYMGIAASGFSPGEGPFDDASQSRTNGGHRITGNRISNGGELVGHGCGILLYQSGDNEIARNTIADMPRYGISLKGLRYGAMPERLYGVPVTWDNHWDFLHTASNRIMFNDISSVMTDSQDGGLIEAWGIGPGNVIHGNFLHDSGIHFSFGFGIYLDDAADGVTVTMNRLTRLYSTGGGKLWMLIFSKGIGNRIAHNLLIDNPMAISGIGTQEMVGEENRDLVIEGNVVSNSGCLYYFVNWREDRFASADRNLFWPGGDQGGDNGAAVAVAGNLPLTSVGTDSLGRNLYTWEQWRSLLGGAFDANTQIAAAPEGGLGG